MRGAGGDVELLAGGEAMLLSPIGEIKRNRPLQDNDAFIVGMTVHGIPKSRLVGPRMHIIAGLPKFGFRGVRSHGLGGELLKNGLQFRAVRRRFDRWIDPGDAACAIDHERHPLGKKQTVGVVQLGDFLVAVR